MHFVAVCSMIIPFSILITDSLPIIKIKNGTMIEDRSTKVIGSQLSMARSKCAETHLAQKGNHTALSSPHQVECMHGP